MVSVNKNGSKENISLDGDDLDFQAGDFVAFTFDDRGGSEASSLAEQIDNFSASDFGSGFGNPEPMHATFSGPFVETKLEDLVQQQKSHAAAIKGNKVSSEPEMVCVRDRGGMETSVPDPEELSRRIVRLTEKLDEESGVAETISGQGCIFVMATTGTGKSTCINYMLGNPLCQKEIQIGDGNFKTVITLTATKELSHVALIGHRNLKAGTTTIQTFPMETEGTNFEGQDIFIVDSCGFHDPEGEDVDIKNAVSLRHAMRQCGSLRPVFLLNAAVVVMDRAKGLLAMLQLFARFFNPVENFIDHFQFFFTHCPNGVGWKEIKAAIYDCLDSKLIKESECLSQIANLIYDQLSKFKEKIILKAEDLTSLGSRRKFLNQVHAVRPIKWEDLQQISLPLSNDVIKELRNMCSGSLQQIQNAISIKPIADVHTAVALVTSLDTLHTSVDVDFVQHRFDEAKTILLDHLNGCVRTTNGTVRKDLGLIEAARMALENDNFNEVAVHMENLRNAQCAKRYKDDIELIYKDMVRKLNSKVFELAQDVLQRPDTDPEDALKLNDLSTITKSCHTFLVGDAEIAYRRAIESIEERAQLRELLCSDGLTVLETVLLGDVHSSRRSGVYVLEVEEREKQCTLFMILFDSLQKLKALQGFKGHVKEYWLNSYSIFKDRFTNCMVNIHGELFGEGRLLARMESCNASAEDCVRLKHLHAIVKSCMSSKFDDIAFDDKGAEALDHLGARSNIRWAGFLGDIVKDVTKIVNNHGDQVAAVVSRGKNLEDVYHFLRLVHSIDLMDPEFRQFKREKNERTHTVVKEKVMSIFESGQLAVARLQEWDLAQGNNIAETCCLISDVFQTLNRASCLSPLIDGLLQVNGDDDSDTGSMLCLLKAGFTRDWKARLSSFRSLVVPNSDVQPSLGFDHDDDESENCSVISATVSTTNDGKLLQQRFVRLDQMQPLSYALDEFREEIHRDSFQLRNDIDSRLAAIFENSDMRQFNDVDTVDTVRFQFEVLNSWLSFVLSLTERKSLIFQNFGDLEKHWASMKLSLQNAKGTLMARIIETSTIANQQSRQLLATALAMSKMSDDLDNMEQICLALKAHLDVQRNNSKLSDCVKGLEGPALVYKEIICFMEAEISRFYREWQQPLIGSPENCDVASIRIVKEFFQQAVVFKDHFPNMLDISQMATTLDVDYRSVINRTHDEVVKLLQDNGDENNFSRIANLLQPHAEPAQGPWGRQEKAVFASCNTALVGFSRRFVRECELIQKGLLRQIQTTQQVIECIDDLRDKLSVGRRAMHIQSLVTSGPIEMVNAVATTCNMLFEKLQEKFERELNKFGFVQASDIYKCICDLGMLSLDFDIFREQAGDDPSLMTKEAPFKEGDARCQIILFRDRSSELKLTHVDNLATNIKNVCHHYLGLFGDPIALDSSDDEAFAVTPPFARMWLGNMCNGADVKEKSRGTIEPVKMHKLKQLYKAITCAVAHVESDGNLFEGEINFEAVKWMIEPLLIESASAALKQATAATRNALATHSGGDRIEIEQRFAENAVNALKSAALVCNVVVKEFDLSIDDEDPFETIKSLKEAIRIRQTSVMIGIDEDTFDFFSDQIVKISNYISCLDRESPQKVYHVKRNLAEKMKTKGHHFGLDRVPPPTMASEHMVDLIDFVTALNQFEDSVQFNNDDDPSRRLLKKFNENFLSHTCTFYYMLEEKAKKGQRLLDVKADVKVFETALTDHVGFITNERVKVHCESLIARVGTLLASVEIQIEHMRTAQTMVAHYDLFAVEDMETIVKNLTVLANQSNTMPNFGSMEVCGFDFDSTRDALMKQLEGAKAKVEDSMAQNDFDTIVIGLNNILKLKVFGPMASLCDQQANMIVMKVRHRQKQLLDDFVAKFGQHSYSGLDPIIANASSLDKSTNSVQDDGVQVFKPVMETIQTAFRDLLDDLLRRSSARNEEEYASVIFEMKSIVGQISSVSIQTMVDQRIEQYIGDLSAKRADFYKLGGFLIRLGPAGEEVTDRYAQFKAVKTKRLNALFQTKGITLDHALTDMGRGNPSRRIPPLAESNVATLRKVHQQYDSKFQDFFAFIWKEVEICILWSA